MVKVEGLSGKLEPKFQGRYKVKGIAFGGNYVLESATGKKLKKNYPITKLKPIFEDDNKVEISAEIEHILGKRKNPDNDKIEYLLVKWKDFDEDQNEWVPTENFDDLKIINEYNEKIHRNTKVIHNSPVEPALKRGRGRPRKTNLASALTIVQFVLFIVGVTCEKKSNSSYSYLEKKLVYCDKGMNRPVLTANNCIIRSKFKEEDTEIDLYFTGPQKKQEYANKFKDKLPKILESKTETKGNYYETMMAVIIL